MKRCVLLLLFILAIAPAAAQPPPFSVVIQQQLPGQEFPQIVERIEPGPLIIYAISIAQWPDQSQMLVELDPRFELLGMGGDGNLIGEGNTFTTGPSSIPWTKLWLWGKLQPGVSVAAPLSSRFSGQGVAINVATPIIPYRQRMPIVLR